MPRTNFEELLEAGVHFGHLRRKWNPKMAPYIFMEKNGIHIIDLHKTVVKIDEAAGVMKQLAYSGRKILFVATKKQAKEIVAEAAKAAGMPYVTERWPGGMLTNFPTIRKAVKKMNTIDKMITDGTFETLAKRERLQITRQRAKLEKNLGSIADLNRLPAALFVVDIQKEMNAVKEAIRLNIPIIAMVDTCCDPTPIDFVIPANDDAAKSIDLIINVLCVAIQEGTNERKLEKDKEGPDEYQIEREEAPLQRRRMRKGGPRPTATVEEEPITSVEVEEPAVAVAEKPVAAVVEPVVAIVEPAVVAVVEPAVAVVEPAVAAVVEPIVAVVEPAVVAVVEPIVAVVEPAVAAVVEPVVAAVEPAVATVVEPAVAAVVEPAVAVVEEPAAAVEEPAAAVEEPAVQAESKTATKPAPGLLF